MKNKNYNYVVYALTGLILLFFLLSFVYPFAMYGVFLSILVTLVYQLLHGAFFSNHQKGSKRYATYVYLTGISILFCIAFYGIRFFQLDEKVAFSPTLLLFTLFVFVFGNLAPRIPFNRTLGLRLPWTVNHEPTWRYAHRLIGYMSFPIVFFLIVALLLNNDNLYGITILAWVCVPSIASFVYYRRWMQGKMSE